MTDPHRWQPLALKFFKDQACNIIIGGYPDFLSPEWGQVTSFSLTRAVRTIYQRDGFNYWVFRDPGAPPYIGTESDEYYRWGFELVSTWSSHLDPTDGVLWDISPRSIGNAPLPDPDEYESFYDLFDGGDWGKGYHVNPVTGEPYAPQIVPRGDYARVLAEFWADGPASETPPGHWFTIANYVSDHELTVKRLAGQGPILGDLEWDVKLYLALGGAVHDCAVSAWGIKGWYDYLRPISALRYMADRGQSSDPKGPSYHVDGVRLYPDFIEVVTEESTALGERHEHLKGEEGKIAVNAWRGPDYIIDPETDEAGVGWILAENWWPYQRPSFVTPPFAGYISGHSTFSRAAAEVLTQFTGSPWFPGGLGEFYCPMNEFLVFEDGPSVDVTLQWASYYDASDQTSLSRIWGGIHPPADDIPGRIIGSKIGRTAFNKALSYFTVGDGCRSGNVDVDAGNLPSRVLYVNGSLGDRKGPCGHDRPRHHGREPHQHSIDRRPPRIRAPRSEWRVRRLGLASGSRRVDRSRPDPQRWRGRARDHLHESSPRFVRGCLPDHRGEHVHQLLRGDSVQHAGSDGQLARKHDPSHSFRRFQARATSCGSRA